MGGGWRDAGINLQLPDRGPVTGMVEMSDHLLVFQPGRSYAMRPPHVMDPENANPNMPWVVAESSLPGSRNSTVARLVLQPKMLMAQAGIEQSWCGPALAATCVSIAEQVLACEAVHAIVDERVRQISARIANGEVVAQNGLLIDLPQVADLDQQCTQFLISTRRAIRYLCTLVSYFCETQDKHSHFNKLLAEIKASKFAGSPMEDHIDRTQEQVRLLVDFRNSQEHPGPTRTVIENFRLAVDGSISRPSWKLEGVLATPRYSIVLMMKEAIRFLVDCAEAIVIHGFMLHRNPRYIVQFIEIEPADRNPDCPIAFEIKLHIPRQ